MGAEELIITLTGARAARSKPYHRQVYDQVRGAILEGRLRSGDRLPATRELAATLNLARNTVVRAYEDLLAEGYLEARPGSGSYVSPFLGKMPPADRDGRLGRPVAARAAPLDAGGQKSSAGGGAKRLPFDFRPGIPDWDAFPRALWLRLIGRALRKNAVELGRYGEPGGTSPSGKPLPGTLRFHGARSHPPGRL